MKQGSFKTCPSDTNLMKSMIRDEIDKEDAFRGLCALVKANPSGALSSLIFMCRALSIRYIQPSEDRTIPLKIIAECTKLMKSFSVSQCVNDARTMIELQVQFLQDLGIRDEAIEDMLVKFPPLLTYNLFNKILPVDCVVGLLYAILPVLGGSSGILQCVSQASRF